MGDWLRELADARGAVVDLHRIGLDPCDAHDGATMESVFCDTLRLLVQPYADHPTRSASPDISHESIP